MSKIVFHNMLCLAEFHHSYLLFNLVQELWLCSFHDSHSILLLSILLFFGQIHLAYSPISQSLLESK